MKRSFSLLEIYIVIFIFIIIGTFTYNSTNNNNLENATNRIILYLKQTRYQALLDNKEKSNDSLWHKSRWTLKFFNCNNKTGLYYTIYSDKNKKGHPNINESLSDPLTNKKVYATNKCNATEKTSKYVLLTKEYGVRKIEISCNNTSSIGQITFGNRGKVYNKLSKDKNMHAIEERCVIALKGQNTDYREIIVEANTGYVYKGNYKESKEFKNLSLD